MFWTEDAPQKPFQVPDHVLECSFSIRCRTLPVDHAYALSLSLQKALPWLDVEPEAAIHQIHIPESGNGWQRPEMGENQCVYLARRTRLKLRLPKSRIKEAMGLKDQTLDIEGHALTVGPGKTRLLSPLDTLISRYVITSLEESKDEIKFTSRVVADLAAIGIQARKLLNGKPHSLRTASGPIYTRSVMLADLSPTDSILLQQKGLGSGRLLGCGLFLPHKGIRAVGESQKE